MTWVGKLKGERKDLYNRLIRFLEFKTSSDHEQRKVWNDWYKELEKLDGPLARSLMADVLQTQYKSRGEVWQGRLKRHKKV